MMNSSVGGTINGKVTAALFRGGENAESAYGKLLQQGFSRDNITILMSDETRRQHFITEDTTRGAGSKALEGTGVGAAAGGTVGAIIGAIAAIGTNLVLPGLGLIVAGPLAAALAGAGAGGATGGLIGALVGSGIPEETAQRYETGLREGGVILAVEPRTVAEAEEAAHSLQSFGGELIYH